MLSARACLTMVKFSSCRLPRRQPRPRPDIVVIGCSQPTLTCIQTAAMASRDCSVPVAMFVGNSGAALAPEAVRAGISAYIVDGLQASRVSAVIDVAIERYRLMDALFKELERSRSDLASRKVIEKAKGLIIEKRGLSEQDAYAMMRQMAMNRGKPLRDIAEMILSVSDILG